MDCIWSLFHGLETEVYESAVFDRNRRGTDPASREHRRNLLVMLS